MRILVVGAGSTGGFFGGRLAQAGRDVTFLVRQGRAEQLRTNGLQISSPHGDFSLTPKLVTADTLDGTYDLILLTVKAYALDAALDDIAPAVGPQTMILPVLNGMRHVEAVRDRFGEQALIGGVCRIVSTLDEQGRIVQVLPTNELFYGELDGSTTPRLEALDALMQGAGFDARRSDCILTEMWEKWTLLASLGGITCLARGSIGEVVAAPGGLAFANRLIDEVLALVSTVGRRPRDEILAQSRAVLTQPGSAFTSSMYRDLVGGHPVEAEQIIGDLLARGRSTGLDTPLLAAAYVHLSVYQNRWG